MNEADDYYNPESWVNQREEPKPAPERPFPVGPGQVFIAPIGTKPVGRVRRTLARWLHALADKLNPWADVWESVGYTTDTTDPDDFDPEGHSHG